MRILLFLLIIISSFIGNSQTYFLNGTAFALGGDCYLLTPAIGNQNGAVWYANQIDLTEPFDLKFEMNFGIVDANGADGIMFVLQTVGTNALGQSGGGLGFLGFQPSFGVEFDTWNNSDYGDIAADHIAMVSDGIVSHLGPTAITNPVQASSTSINIEDGQNHQVRIVWNPVQQEVSVYFDCVFRQSETVDLVNDIFNGQNMVYWGFTAATGGSSNNQTVCLTEDILSPSTSVLTCPNGPVTLATGGDPSGIYSWEPSDFLDDPTSANPICTPTEDISYVVSFTDECGFNTIQTIDVNVEEFSTQIVGDLMINCDDDQTTLSASNNFGNSITYQWEANPGTFTGSSAQSSINVIAGGEITLTATYNNVCVSTDVVEVIADFSEPDVAVISEGSIDCLNTDVELIATSSEPGAIFQWTSPDGLFGAPTNAAQTLASSPGTYTVVVTHPTSGCDASQTLLIENNISYPVIQIGQADTLSCKRPTVQIAGTTVNPPNSDISWTTTSGTIVDGGLTLEPFVGDEGVYTITATIPENGCTSTTDIEVFQDGNVFIDITTLEFPNIFTPNNDGFNDRFAPLLLDDPELTLTPFMGLYQLQVFNRWGVEVYNSNGTPIEWDGRANGIDLTEGVYYYVVEFEIVCDGLGRMTRSGYVQIAK